jgi:cell division protein FtsX
MNFRLALTLGWGTLRARLALTVLALLLTAAGAAAMAGIWGTVYLLHSLQRDFLSALSVELELNSDSEAARSAIMARAENWPYAEFVQYISPEQTLREIQRETGEDLLQLFGANPFPAMVRVRFGRTTLATVDSLTASAKQWPGVAQVVYPRRLWGDVDRFISRFRGNLGLGSSAAVLLIFALVALCLRAQVRNRGAIWEFLRFSGASTGTLRVSVLLQGALIGLFAGLLAGAILLLLVSGYGWLFFRDVALPLEFYAIAWLFSILLGLLASSVSIRKV